MDVSSPWQEKIKLSKIGNVKFFVITEVRLRELIEIWQCIEVKDFKAGA